MDMTEKELRRLSRPQILDMFAAYEKDKAELQADLKEVTQRLEELKEQNASLQGRLTEAGAKLNNQKIELEEAGSIADAAMKVNGVFEAAQKAADQYLDSVRELKERQEKELAAIAADSKSETDRLLREAQQESDQRTAESKEQAEQILSEANAKAATVKTEADRYALGTRTQAESDAREIREKADAYAAENKAQADQYAADSRSEIEKELSEAQAKKSRLEKETQQNCEAMLAKAKEEAESYWNSLTDRLEGFYRDHAGLRELLGKFDIIKDRSAEAIQTVSREDAPVMKKAEEPVKSSGSEQPEGGNSNA